MRHLFIINPEADKIKGKTNETICGIKAFFQSHPQLDFDIHITRWPRDALGYVRRYVLSLEGKPVRIHAVGGAETLFCVVNGVLDLPNVQVASHFAGRDNNFIKYFTQSHLHLFASLEKQVFSDVIDIDVIRCGHSYGISYVLVGLEAKATMDGDEMIERTHLPPDLCYNGAALFKIITGNYGQSYKMTLDRKELDGNYISMMIANQPWYGQNLCPAVDARPDDGVFDVYTINNISRLRLIWSMNDYHSGNYSKNPNIVSHHIGRKAFISSNEVMHLSIDGEAFYGNNVEIEIVPMAIKFVCPRWN